MRGRSLQIGVGDFIAHTMISVDEFDQKLMQASFKNIADPGIAKVRINLPGEAVAFMAATVELGDLVQETMNLGDAGDQERGISSERIRNSAICQGRKVSR